MTHVRTAQTDALSLLMTSRTMPLVAVASVTFAACVTTWATRRRTRQSLKSLDHRQLEDVGLTPEAARAEARKVFWRA